MAPNNLNIGTQNDIYKYRWPAANNATLTVANINVKYQFVYLSS